jgi:hypothetical protein
MEDYKQLLADFERWTGKGNLIQANQTAAKLFRLIFADREAMVTAETETPVVLTRADRANIANNLQWERDARSLASRTFDPPIEISPPVTVPPAFEDPMTPEEAISVAKTAPRAKAAAKNPTGLAVTTTKTLKKTAPKKAPPKK